MAHEHDAAAPAPAPPAVVAAPAAAPLGVEPVLSLQRTAGNRAVGRAIERGLIQRAGKDVALTGVKVTPGKASVPLAAGVAITAAAQPASATGVTYKLVADSAAPAAGTTIDASTGAVTLDAKQAGGTLKARADTATSWAEQPFQLVEKPAAIASTSGSATGTYKGSFTHTFSSAGASAAGLEGENINEKFDALTADTPFGPFSLQANAAGSKGWDLDASGTMAGPDNVSIGKDVDARPFVKNASNPAPAKALPQSFSMTQKLHAKTFPAGTLDAQPFTTTDHVRTLSDDGGKLQMTLKAGLDSVSIDYAGPAVFRNARADKTSVDASPPKPKAGTWTRNEVQVSVDVEPASAKPKYSIAGEALGCTVDATGKVLIGSTPGTIKVRAGDGDKHYDEVAIEIKAPPAPAAPPTTGGATAAPTAAQGEATD